MKEEIKSQKARDYIIGLTNVDEFVSIGVCKEFCRSSVRIAEEEMKEKAIEACRRSSSIEQFIHILNL
jgi:hypothetical protein